MNLTAGFLANGVEDMGSIISSIALPRSDLVEECYRELETNRLAEITGASDVANRPF